MWFDTWTGLGRVLVISPLAYLALVLMLRVSGKRTLSKMNAFDFIVTIALGSTLATILLSRDVALAEGVLALGLLIALQFVITWLSVRSSAVRQIVKDDPALLFYRGEFLRETLRRERVTESEVVAAARQSGVATLDDLDAVVLETDGSMSVMQSAKSSDRSTLRNVSDHREART